MTKPEKNRSGSGLFTAGYKGGRKTRSLLAESAEAARGVPPGGREGPMPHQRAWFRGLFRIHPFDAYANGFGVSLACHAVLGLLVVAGAFHGAEAIVRSAKEEAANTVEIELPKVAPQPVPVLPASRQPAAPLGEVPGPVPHGRRARKGRDPMEDAARAGVLGMLGNLGGKGYTNSKTRGATPGPDQQSAEPFTGMAGLKDYEGGYLPVGGAGGGGGGAGTDEGNGTGGGRGSGHAKDLLNSYGDGQGDAIILERRGSASGVEGGTGSGDGDGGCRDEAAIARAVEAHKGAIRRCYNAALQTAPDLQGDLSVRFVINEAGGVRTAEVLGRGVSDATLHACVLASIRSWTFGERSGCDTIVRYTFHLSRAF